MGESGKSESESMQVCEYCGEDFVTSPFRRDGRSYCSRSCAEEHEFREPEVEGEENDDPLPEEEQEYN